MLPANAQFIDFTITVPNPESSQEMRITWKNGSLTIDGLSWIQAVKVIDFASYGSKKETQPGTLSGEEFANLPPPRDVNLIKAQPEKAMAPVEETAAVQHPGQNKPTTPRKKRQEPVEANAEPVYAAERAAMQAAFDATPEELGKAAVEAAMKPEDEAPGVEEVPDPLLPPMEIKNASKMRDLIVILHEKHGMRASEIVTWCQAAKSNVSLLSGVSDVESRVTRAMEVLGINQ